MNIAITKPIKSVLTLFGASNEQIKAFGNETFSSMSKRFINEFIDNINNGSEFESALDDLTRPKEVRDFFDYLADHGVISFPVNKRMTLDYRESYENRLQHRIAFDLGLILRDRKIKSSIRDPFFLLSTYEIIRLHAAALVEDLK